MPSTIAIVAQTTVDANKLADDALAVAKDHFDHSFLVLFSLLDQSELDILYYILHEIHLHGKKL